MKLIYCLVLCGPVFVACGNKSAPWDTTVTALTEKERKYTQPSACPNDCSHHGQCLEGVCTCDLPWSGKDCSHMEESGDCKNACSKHGWCVNGTCHCLTGWNGIDCSSVVSSLATTCPKNCSGHGECHGSECICDLGYSGLDCSEYNHIVKEPCSNNCSGNGLCFEGACKCFQGWQGQDCSIAGKMLAHNLIHNRVQAKIHGWGALGSAVSVVVALVMVACFCSCGFNALFEGRHGYDAFPCADAYRSVRPKRRYHHAGHIPNYKYGSVGS